MSDQGDGGLPLSGVRVVELSSGIAGGYATKLLTDGGAEVIKVESPEGDPLRRWSASRSEIAEGESGPLFNHLAASKRSVVVDPEDPDDLATLHDLLGGAEAVVWSDGSAVAAHSSLAPDAIAEAHPDLTVTAISPFGLDSSWTDRPASELTLQAWAGGLIRLARGHPDLPPTYVGGQVGQWLSGTYAAVGTLASLRQGGGRLVDVSVLEVLAACLTYVPVTFHDVLGRPIREDRFVPTPGVAEAKDGMVGLGTGTGQQFLDFCAMIGRDDWMQDRSLLAERAHLRPEINAWVAEHTVDEVLALASAFRLPKAPIGNGQNVTGIEHFRERDLFRPNPTDGAVNPKPPFRIDGVKPRTPEPAPALGGASVGSLVPRGSEPRRHPATGRLPFEGLRVLDMTAFWAGPLTGQLLGMLGAEVIHVESPKRPDGVRLVGGVPQTEDRHWEHGPIFAALNTNKKSLAVDLGDERGVQVVRDLVATCDVVVENYTPRVLDNLGLGHEALLADNPELLVLRMPGFGLDGPWRDVAAFAFVIEDAAGLTWLSGHPEVPPIEPYSLGDPNAGLHALFALQLALEHRDRTGRGGLVESAMVDAALNITAEQVIEHSAFGATLRREGNRGPTAAPQGVYQVTGMDEYGIDSRWVAIAVETDEQWSALVGALGSPDWARDAALSTEAGRRAALDAIDEHLGAWCRDRSADEVVDLLWGAGVPVSDVVQPHHQADLAPFQDRGFFERLEHPVSGEARYATLPLRFSDEPAEWHRHPAPLLGAHNAELLAEIGLSADQIGALEADGVIGTKLAGAD